MEGGKTSKILTNDLFLSIESLYFIYETKKLVKIKESLKKRIIKNLHYLQVEYINISLISNYSQNYDNTRFLRYCIFIFNCFMIPLHPIIKTRP